MLIVSFKGLAQDQMYSFFLAAPLHLNPALAGTSNSCDRLTVNYRNQYPALKDAFVYYGAGYDRYVQKMNGGIGFQVQRSVEGDGYYNKNAANLTYAFHGIQTRNFRISAALQAGITTRSVDYSKLVFYDQIDERTGVIPGAPTEASLPINNNKIVPDFSTGVAIVGKRYMFGASVFHLTEPDEALINTSSPLPRRYNAHGSFNIPLTPKKNVGDPTLIPAFMVNSQNDALTIMGGLQYKIYYFNVGAWYRSAQAYDGGNAIVCSFLFDGNNLVEDSRIAFGFAYDYSLVKFGERNNGGTIELSLVYQTQKCTPKRKKITCPAFY